MLKIYCSTPFKHYKEMEDLVYLALCKSKTVDNHCKFILPQCLESELESFVFSDLKMLEESDILLIHIPEPSVGACAELGYFKACNPTKPIIGYKCMIHPWIKHLCNFQIDHVDQLVEILETMILGKKEISPYKQGG